MSSKKQKKSTLIAEVADGKIKNKSNKSKPSLLEEIEIMKASGQTGSPEFVEKMKQLEVILGISQVNPFGTNEMEIFQESLKEMSTSDLQALARKVGVNPYLDRPLLKQTLIKEFGHYTKNSRRNIIPSTSNTFVPDPEDPKHQKLIKILADI